MRTAHGLCTLAILGLLAGGCDDTPPNEMNDLAMPDLSAAADMATEGDDTCLQVITCAAGCSAAPQCVQACAAAGTASAQEKYQALATCALTACLPGGAASADGGTAPCTGPTDTSMGCHDCISGQAQGPGCATELTACLTDG